jgi:hypothetical protein
MKMRGRVVGDIGVEVEVEDGINTGRDPVPPLAAPAMDGVERVVIPNLNLRSIGGGAETRVDEDRRGAGRAILEGIEAGRRGVGLKVRRRDTLDQALPHRRRLLRI